MSQIIFHRGDFFTSYQSFKDVKADLLIVDPPYGIMKELEWDKAIDWGLAEEIFAEILKPFGQIVIFCNFSLMVSLQSRFSNHFKFRHFHVWHKPGGMPVSRYSPVQNAEFILLFSHSGVKPNQLVFNPYETLQSGQPYVKRNLSAAISTRAEKKKSADINLNGKRHVKSIISAPGKPNMVKDERTRHQTQKPLQLIRELIRVYSCPGQQVISPFAGSGTDLIAAKIEGRDCLGFEINNDFYDEAIERIRKCAGQLDLFDRGIEGSQVEDNE